MALPCPKPLSRAGKQGQHDNATEEDDAATNQADAFAAKTDFTTFCQNKPALLKLLQYDAAAGI
jgi:hypothetical protein